MYVILVNNDNSLSATVKQRIMQRSKLVDTLYFIVDPIYNKYDLTNATVVLEYLLPVSKKYRSEILVLSEERYKGHLKYVLPIDTELTSEAGDVELQLSFVRVDMDEHGNDMQYVRKTSSIRISIIPISAWSDIIPDSALSAIDQRIIKADAQIKALNDIAAALDEEKADSLKYHDNILQLMANGKEIGNAVNINSCDGEDLEDGVPVVDFGRGSGSTPDNDSDDVNNVVEF